MLHALVELLGSLALLLLLIYAAGFWVYEKVRKPETPTAVDPKHMPVMQPIPIPTKHHASNLMKLLVMLFEVRRWQICRNWLFLYRPRHGEPVLLVIPEGFRFDGASIPRPFWSRSAPLDCCSFRALSMITVTATTRPGGSMIKAGSCPGRRARERPSGIKCFSTWADRSTALPSSTRLPGSL